MSIRKILFLNFLAVVLFYTRPSTQTLSIQWSDDSFDLVFMSEGKALTAQLGRGVIPSELVSPTPCSENEPMCWKFGSLISLNVSASTDGKCFSIQWTSHFKELKDCINLGTVHWYGGGQIFVQHWVIDNDERSEKAFVTGDFFLGKMGGVLEPYWLNSDGFALHVDRTTPLFVSQNDEQNSQLCLIARHESPYTNSDPLLHLGYNLCAAEDVKAAHLTAASRFWSKPRGVPDRRMFTHPIWSTWARYKGQVNQNKTLTFGSEIRRYGFNDSQLELDDNWETCYGELEFDPEKFPNPVEMVTQLKNQGFRVTLWIHPFLNTNCPSFTTSAQYMVPGDNGLPGLTSWWRGNPSGILDFSRSHATEWWSSRVQRLATNVGIDSFKFDAGESNWLPACHNLANLPVDEQPNGFTELYARNMERFGSMVELRAAWNSQDVPFFTRMLDKESVWSYQNGLKTLLTSLLLFNLQGYPFVLPDMVGGNGYIILPPKELFIRWLQANVFMPAIQFSYVPWDYDQEVRNDKILL